MLTVVGYRLVFGEVVRVIFVTSVPENIKNCLLSESRSQCNVISHAFERFSCIFPFTNPAAVELSVLIGIGSRGCPI